VLRGVEKGGTGRSLERVRMEPGFGLSWHRTRPNQPVALFAGPILEPWKHSDFTTREAYDQLPLPRTGQTEPQLGDLKSQTNGLDNPTLAVTEKTSLSRSS
jgi:hypothetical protein